MRYNDRNVVTAVNVYRVIGYTEPHAVRYYAKRHGIEYWTLSGRALDDFKDSNGFRSSCNRLTVYDADGFTGLQRNKPMKEEEKAMIRPTTMKEFIGSTVNPAMKERLEDVRDNSAYDTPANHIFDGQNVEWLAIDNEPYFGLASVASVLDISNPKMSIDTKDRDYVVKLTNKDISEVSNAYFRKLNNRGELFLTEAGTYKFVLCSRKPNAERFQKWVTKEVLPSIRKTGGYGADSIERKVDALARSMSALWLYLSTRDAMAAGFSKEIANRELR